MRYFIIVQTLSIHDEYIHGVTIDKDEAIDIYNCLDYPKKILYQYDTHNGVVTKETILLSTV
jgi:hypothetical protein